MELHGIVAPFHTPSFQYVSLWFVVVFIPAYLTHDLTGVLRWPPPASLPYAFCAFHYYYYYYSFASTWSFQIEYTIYEYINVRKRRLSIFMLTFLLALRLVIMRQHACRPRQCQCGCSFWAVYLKGLTQFAQRQRTDRDIGLFFL